MPELTGTTPIDPEKQFVVALKEQLVTWGPFESRSEAATFAAFVTAVIGPAEVRALSSPVGELLAWRDAMKELDRA